jgi:hypothetical protein
MPMVCRASAVSHRHAPSHSALELLRHTLYLQQVRQHTQTALAASDSSASRTLLQDDYTVPFKTSSILAQMDDKVGVL